MLPIKKYAQPGYDFRWFRHKLINPKFLIMKTYLIFAFALLISFPAIAQKKGKVVLSKKDLYALNLKIQKSKASPQFKALMKTVLVAKAEKEEKDCTPPPCPGGIVDPWNCICYPDIVDPWEDDKVMAQRFSSFNQAETLAVKGKGGAVSPALVKQALEIFPSRSFADMLGRLSFYAKQAK